MTDQPATLATTERGVTRDIFTLTVGDYIWHRGAFRRVTAIDGTKVTMGCHVLHSTAYTVEAASAAAVISERRRALRAETGAA